MRRWLDASDRYGIQPEDRSCHIVVGVFTRILAKHSKSFSFIDCISVGVDRMQQSFESFWKPGSRSRSRPGAVSTDFTNSGYAMTRNSGPATLPPAG
jgi:hypothetical protein